QTPEGISYTFDLSGQITAINASTDLAHPAAAIYGYDNQTGYLSTVTDPVTGRSISLAYSKQARSDGSDNPCGPPANGYAQAPIGMLCQISYWDGTQTLLHYDGGGDLARIENPGGEDYDYGYSGGALAWTRAPLQNDMVNAGLVAADASARFDIGYSGG